MTVQDTGVSARPRPTADRQTRQEAEPLLARLSLKTGMDETVGRRYAHAANCFDMHQRTGAALAVRF